MGTLPPPKRRRPRRKRRPRPEVTGVAIHELIDGPETSAETDGSRELTLRERLLWRTVEMEHSYLADGGRWAPTSMPFGWGVACGTLRSRGHTPQVIIAPFPLNIVIGLGVWAYRRLLLAPLIDTSLGDTLIAREVAKRTKELEDQMELELNGRHAERRRGLAAELALRAALSSMAKAGLSPETAWVDASHHVLLEDGKWHVIESDMDPDCYQFRLDEPVADRPKVAELPPLDMDALRVGGAYEQRDDDEF